MTRRAHRSPFGAEVTTEGVAFNIYAPDVERVELLIEGRAPVVMDNDGPWKRAHTRAARAGDAYSYRLPGGLIVPDPASRFQPRGVGGPSRVIDPRAYEWRDAAWRGRPWSEAVIYEAHIGAATHEGTYAAFSRRLPDLADLGVTAIELMPLAQWPGARNWGYDGVLPFAPCCAYGAPDELKALIDHAHACGLIVLIDVVYNHFGPSGNYLHAYARSFFTNRHETPWGAAINFDDAGREAVRSFFVHNALYWIEEFNADGLRLDAAHAMHDDSERHILADISHAVRDACPGRLVHLVLENDANESKWLERKDDGVSPRFYTAQWNDDAHHCWHTLLSGEQDGYYAEFADHAPARLARALAQGFVYQGDPSAFRNGEKRGEHSASLHPAAFVDFLQNHDQIGNRAFGERIDAIADPRRVAVTRAALLLSPHIPLLFMGEEWATQSPFLYFTDFTQEPDLAAAVRDGRRQEFAHFARFAEAGSQDIPDPNAWETFAQSRLDEAEKARAPHAVSLATTQRLLRIRAKYVTPLLESLFVRAESSVDEETGSIDIYWRFESGALRMVIQIDPGPVEFAAEETSAIYSSEGVCWSTRGARLAGWSLIALRS